MIEVFQNLVLRGDPTRRADLKAALLVEAQSPWRHAADKEEELRTHASSADVVVFERSEGDGLPAAGLVLWESPTGYEVTNIVPRNASSLTYSQYNDILQDFVVRIATSAATLQGFTVETSKAQKTLEDFANEKVTRSLRRFSAAANKSTSAGHPLDEKRWHTFLIAAHQDNAALDASTLARWLHEDEGWPEDVAHALAVEYETGRALLKSYDAARE